MKTYLDSNFIVRLYLEMLDSEEAMSAIVSRRQDWPYPVTTLQRMEVLNAIARMAYESSRGGPWRVTSEWAAIVRADFEKDLSEGIFVTHSPLALVDIEEEFVRLSDRYTPHDGFRTYDLIHVASARVMGGKRFLTFDVKARRLATLAGLKTD